MAGDPIVMESRKRKRTRVSTSPSDGDEESRKRGRPRVDKQDESAADRRRTQIRMAQRAYRQRKESTLEDLRKRVSELTNCLELMNKTFTDFRDRMSANASDTQQLDIRETSGQYESLMKAVRNPDDEPSELQDAHYHSLNGASVDAEFTTLRRPQPTNVASWLDPFALHEAQKVSEPVGMGIRMESNGAAEEQPVDFFNAETRSQALVPRSEQHVISDAMINTLPEEIQVPKPIPPITTYSFQETTFARRLHRSCLEAAYYLLLDSSRRKETFEKVFKLSLMGKDPIKLTRHLKSMLARGPTESLDFWEAPLIHVGGAGTHYPRKDHLGNLTPRKSSYNLGLVGPQTLALLENAAKNNLSTDMTVEIAGYEGDWYDPYDVEGYLEERGIHIDPASSFVEAEITEDPESVTGSSSGPPTPPLEIGPDAAAVFDVDQNGVLDNEILGAGTSKWDDFTSLGLTDVGYSDALTGDWMNFLEPGQGINPVDRSTHNNNPIATWNGFGSTELMQESLISVLDHSTYRPPYSQPKALPAPRPTHRKKKVIIDVSKLVKGLSGRGICLGRTPGYKRQDVDRALAMASFDM